MKCSGALTGMLLLILLNGCIPLSKNPISKNRRIEDKNLFGRWVVVKGNEPDLCPDGKNIYEIIRKHKGMMLLRVTRPSGKHQLPFQMHISRLKSGNFINFTDSKKQQQYFFARYQVTAGMLTLKMLRHDAVINAVKAGVIRGEINKSGAFDQQVSITDSSRNIQRLIEAGQSHDFFGPGCRFRRVYAARGGETPPLP